MGHALSVHRNSYRLQDRTLELAKASKLFLAVDGSHTYAGKTLDEITLDGKILFTCIKVCNAHSIFWKMWFYIKPFIYQHAYQNMNANTMPAFILLWSVNSQSSG